MPEVLRSTPMRLAMTSSFVAHLVLAGALLWQINRTTSPSLTQRVTLLTFARAPADDPDSRRGEERPEQRLAGGSPEPPETKATGQLDAGGHPQAAALADAPDMALPDPAPFAGAALPAAPASPGAAASRSLRPQGTETREAQPVAAVPVAKAAAHPISALSAPPGVAEAAVDSAVAESEDDARTDARSPVASRIPVSAATRDMLARRFEDLASDLVTAGDGVRAVRWRHGDADYEARLVTVSPATETDLAQAAIEITRRQEGALSTTRMSMKQMAFSSFAQFVNRWDPDVEMHNDELDGRFHSNSALSITSDRHGSPAFLGKVTTASRTVNFGHWTARRQREQIFRGGLETGVRSIPLPARYLPFPAAASLDDYDIHRFDDDTRIVFHGDGSFAWRTANSRLPWQRTRISRRSAYLMAAPRARLFLRGTVRGRVLVYSPERIVVEGDLVYASHSGSGAPGDSLLGLVSERSIEIAAPEITGHGDVTIHAALYAGQRFAVKNFRARHQGTLHIFGSLTAGTMSASEPRFATRITFDTRLADHRPPGFPVTPRYEITDWDGKWTEVIASEKDPICGPADARHACAQGAATLSTLVAGQ